MAFSIEITTGNSEVDEDDKARAKAAAQAIFDKHVVTSEVCGAEFERQWEFLGSDENVDAGGPHQEYASMTGLAAIWVEADAAANKALTQGWARPEGASCTIVAD